MPQPVFVFDLGGVLIDWNPRYLYRKLFADEAEMEYFLNHVCTPEWNLAQDAGRSFAEGTRLLIAQFPHYEAEIRAYDERWEEMIRGAIDGSVGILQTLHKKGYALYALTNWSTEKFPVAQRKFPFLALFRQIIVSGEEKCIKPDPQLYRLMLDRIGHTAKECIFIDDNLANVITAQQLGFQAIHFQSPAQLREALCALKIEL